MKRFLMFLVIAIAVVSLGLTIYYFSTDNEVIYIKSSYLVVEKGDYIQAEGENGLLEFKHRSEHTTLSYGLQQEDHEDETKNVLSYNEENPEFNDSYKQFLNENYVEISLMLNSAIDFWGLE